MPSQITAHVSASHDVAFLNQEVTQGEQLYGTLSSMGNDGSTTTLTFAATGLPTTTAVIAPQIGGQPNIPPGQSLVCTGTLFVLGQLVLCAATR